MVSLTFKCDQGCYFSYEEHDEVFGGRNNLS